MHPYQKELLENALQGREKEVIEYQVNVDNFTRAIALIGGDEELQEFKSQLQSLLASTLLEQRKAQVMLDVVRMQLEV